MDGGLFSRRTLRPGSSQAACRIDRRHETAAGRAGHEDTLYRGIFADTEVSNLAGHGRWLPLPGGERVGVRGLRRFSIERRNPLITPSPHAKSGLPDFAYLMTQ